MCTVVSVCVTMGVIMWDCMVVCVHECDLILPHQEGIRKLSSVGDLHRTGPYPEAKSPGLRAGSVEAPSFCWPCVPPKTFLCPQTPVNRRAEAQPFSGAVSLEELLELGP